MIKRAVIISILFVSLLNAGDTAAVVTFLPKNKFVPVFTASGAEHRISYNKYFDRGMFVGSMGGSFPVADVRIHGSVCQISAASTVYTSLQNAGIKFKVTDVNFYVDISFDVPVSDRTVVRAGWGHTSHHLADDAAAAGIVPVNYARDYYSLYAVHSFPSAVGTGYGGVQWTYSFLINRNVGRKLMPHLGGEIILLPLSDDFRLYGALDLKFRGELEFGSTQRYQIGLVTRNEMYRAVRLAYTFRTGLEERGQFYNLRENVHTIGIFFDF